MSAVLAVSTTLTVVLPSPAEARRSSTRVVREPINGAPLTIIVSLREQRLQVFDQKGLVAQAPISSGRPGNRTPTGIFSILQKNRQHYSNLYNSAPMPNMQRLTWSGIALHAGDLPGYPASHGCIRLPYSFSRSLFSMTDLGTRVIVTDDAKEPEHFSHPLMFAALPPGNSDVPPPDRLDSETAHQARTNQSTVTGVGTVSAMLGVTPAAAAEAAIGIAARGSDENTTVTGAISKPRTRAMARAERQSEIDARTNIVSEREAAHAKAAEVLADINNRLRQAQVDLRKSQIELPKLARITRDRVRELSASERRIKDFIRQQIRETARAEAREVTRREQHGADAASDLESEVLLKRADARKFEAEKDAAKLAEAADKETQLEAELLDSIHDMETAKLFETAQTDIIAARDSSVKAIAAELVAARKNHVAARKDLNDAREDLKRAVASLAQFEKPATVFISRRNGMLRIRQGFEDVYQSQIGIKFPESRLGTHVFTALDYADATQTNLNWQVVTVTDVTPELPRRSYRNRDDTAAANTLPPAPTASNAIERIELPADVSMRISELVKPGSTLIVTDDGVSPETGKFTDIIVQPRL